MKSQHRRSTLANLVCSLIEHTRITTTIAKAKEARRYADKMVTLAKKGTLHHRRQAIAFLRHKPAVTKLFAELGKQHGDRNGGYTRIIRVGQRLGDAAEMAILEWTGTAAAAPEPEKTGRRPRSQSPKRRKRQRPPRPRRSLPKRKKKAPPSPRTPNIQLQPPRLPHPRKPLPFLVFVMPFRPRTFGIKRFARFKCACCRVRLWCGSRCLAGQG